MKSKPKLIASVDEAIQLPSVTPACLNEFQEFISSHTDKGLEGVIPARKAIKDTLRRMIYTTPLADKPEVKDVSKAIKHLSQVNILHNLKKVQKLIADRIKEIQDNPTQYFEARQSEAKSEGTEPQEESRLSQLIAQYEVYFNDNQILTSIIEHTVKHKSADDLITAIDKCQSQTIRKKICTQYAQYILQNPDKCGPTHIHTAIHLMGEAGHSKDDLSTLCGLISASGSANLYASIAPLLQEQISDTEIFAVYAKLTLKFGDESQHKQLIQTIEAELESDKVKANAEIIRVYSLLQRKYQKRTEAKAHKILGYLRPLINNNPETLAEYAYQAHKADNQECFRDAMKRLAGTGNPQHLLTMAKLAIKLNRDDFYDLALVNLQHNFRHGAEFIVAYARIILTSKRHEQLRQTAIFNLKKYENESPKAKKLLIALNKPTEEAEAVATTEPETDGKEEENNNPATPKTRLLKGNPRVKSRRTRAKVLATLARQKTEQAKSRHQVKLKCRKG